MRRRMADRLRAPWTALHVETAARLRRSSEAERDRIAEALRLAERLGGEAVTVPGEDVADTIARLRPRPTTSPTSSSASRAAPRWSEMLRGSIVAAS